jgi:peptidoglycan/xylan/chitin deacetylase (PgdA/CDA1 family)
VEKDDHGAHPYLLWPELAQMVASGAFHVQSHSVTHRRHTELTPEQMREELTASRRRITEELGVPSNFYAFPFGGFDTRYRDLAEEVGYRGALSVGKGPGTRYGLLRHSLLKGDEHVLRSVLQSELGAPSRR